MHLADAKITSLIVVSPWRPNHLDDDLDFAVLVKEHRYWLVALREPLWSRQADPAPVVSRQHPKRAVVPGLRLAQERGSKDERYLGLGLAQFFSLCARQRLARLGRRTATAPVLLCFPKPKQRRWFV